MTSMARKTTTKLNQPPLQMENTHLPSGTSAGLTWNAWLTRISWASAMLVTPLAVSINSSTETNLGGLAVRHTIKRMMEGSI